jgi:tRNA(adenine34) deaminase
MQSLILILACLTPGDAESDARAALALAAAEEKAEAPPAKETVTAEEQAERDEIFMLAAYAWVLKDWQTPDDRPGRGHNIGSILVDSDGHPVFAARNENMLHKNTTRHGEVNLCNGYLEKTQKNTLRGYTVYTTLEPCAMCSGMMTLAEVSRCVYGQTDPSYGKALERLQFDSHTIGGYLPYPRPVKSERSECFVRMALDAAYKGDSSLTSWLRTPEAKAIFQEASDSLQTLYPVSGANVGVLSEVQKLVYGERATKEAAHHYRWVSCTDPDQCALYDGKVQIGNYRYSEEQKHRYVMRAFHRCLPDGSWGKAEALYEVDFNIPEPPRPAKVIDNSPRPQMPRPPMSLPPQVPSVPFGRIRAGC